MAVQHGFLFIPASSPVAAMVACVYRRDDDPRWWGTCDYCYETPDGHGFGNLCQGPDDQDWLLTPDQIDRVRDTVDAARAAYFESVN